MLFSGEFIKYFAVLCDFVCVCLCMFVYTSVRADNVRRRASDPLKLESEVVVSHQTWVLGAELQE